MDITIVKKGTEAVGQYIRKHGIPQHIYVDLPGDMQNRDARRALLESPLFFRKIKDDFNRLAETLCR